MGIAYQMLLYHTSCYIVSVSDRNLLWAGIVSGVKIAKHLSDEDAAISYQMLYFMVSDEVLLVLIHLIYAPIGLDISHLHTIVLYWHRFAPISYMLICPTRAYSKREGIVIAPIC